MKPRDYFNTDEQYRQYLIIYFTAQVATGLSGISFQLHEKPDELSELAVTIATKSVDAALKSLTSKTHSNEAEVHHN